MTKTSVTVPTELLQRARAQGVNASEVLRQALTDLLAEPGYQQLAEAEEAGPDGDWSSVEAPWPN